MSDETEHPELTEQEYRWVLGHVEEIEERMDRLMELTDTDHSDDVPLVEAYARFSSFALYVRSQMRSQMEEQTDE